MISNDFSLSFLGKTMNANEKTYGWKNIKNVNLVPQLSSLLTFRYYLFRYLKALEHKIDSNKAVNRIRQRIPSFFLRVFSQSKNVILYVCILGGKIREIFF